MAFKNLVLSNSSEDVRNVIQCIIACFFLNYPAAGASPPDPNGLWFSILRYLCPTKSSFLENF